MGNEYPVSISDPHRQKHIDFFRSMQSPHYLLTAHENITALADFVKSKQLPFTPVIVWILSKIAHDIPEFKWRFRKNEIIEHELLRPSFTVLTSASEVFSFCTVPFHQDFSVFVLRAQAEIRAMQDNPSFEDEPGKDDYLFMSSIPWVSFTNIQHPMHYPSDSVPRIAWGKFYQEGDQVRLPVSVQAHHALVDGIHMGRFFEQFRIRAAQPDAWL